MTKLIEITGKALSGEWGSEDEAGTGIPVLRTTNFTNYGVINYDNVVTRNITKKNISEKFLKKGDIIIEKSGGSDKQPVGRVVLFNGEDNRYLFNNFTGVLRIKDREKWEPEYVFYALFSNYRNGGTRKYENKTTGLHNLKTDLYLSNYEIEWIDIERQKRACMILQKIESIISDRNKELIQLDELVKARFVEMFGDKNFGARPFKDVCDELFAGGDVKKDRTVKEADSDHPYAVFTNGEKDGGLYGYTDIARVIKPSITISGRGTIGFCLVRTEPFYPAIRLIVATPKENLVTPSYLKYFIDSKDYNGRGASIPQLTIPMIKDEPVPIPPIELQNQFETFIAQVDKSKFAVQKSLEKTQQLFDSLMQEYFG